jgi:hypothetical protein
MTLFLLALTPQLLRANGPEQDELQTICERVRQAGAYSFDVDVIQTITLLPTEMNAGRSACHRRAQRRGSHHL